MNKQINYKIATIILIIIIAGAIIGYALWNDGFNAGRGSIERDIFRGLVYQGYFNFFFYDGNQTQVVKLMPYIPQEQG